MITMTYWTTEQTATVTRLWLDGKSAGEIGAAMRMTRNAIIGKVHRLKLKRPDAVLTQRQRDSQGPRKWAYKPRQRPALPSLPPFATMPPMRLKQALPSKPVPVTGGVTLWDLTGCKWPVNDGHPVFLFCNEPRANQRYCQHHEWLSTHPAWRGA